MRICILNRVNDRSEAALVEGLHQRGHEVVYIGEERDPSHPKFSALGIPTHSLLVSNRFSMKAVKQLRKILDQYEFDLIYSPAARTLSALLRASKGNTYPICSYRGTLTRLSKLNPLDRMSILSSRVDLIICNSRAVKDRLQSFGAEEDKLRIVYKGHDLSWYDVEPAPEFDQLGIADDAFVVGCIANFRPMKGGALLLKAVQEVSSKIPIHLVLVGSIRDPQMLSMLKQSELQACVTALGFRKDAIRWIQHFDLAVLPSLKKESFSRFIVEAMAQNVPVAVSDVGGMTELVKQQASGLVFPAGQVDHLQSAIMEAYSEPERMQAMQVEAKNILVKNFSLEQYVFNMESAFSGLRK